MKAEARTSCSSFSRRVPLILSPLLWHYAQTYQAHLELRLQSMVEIPEESQLYMFHKGCFCPDVFLIVVLRQMMIYEMKVVPRDQESR